MTPQEVKLWVHLRSWKGRGFHFRRQVPLDDFIVDFACLKLWLIVEIDGGQHTFTAHYPVNTRSIAKAMRNSLWSCPLRETSISPTGRPSLRGRR